MLFAADGEALASSATFHAKLALLALALANAAAFRLRWRSNGSGELSRPSPGERASALLSLGLWLCIATIGRLIAYY